MFQFDCACFRRGEARTNVDVSNNIVHASLTQTQIQISRDPQTVRTSTDGRTGESILRPSRERVAHCYRNMCLCTLTATWQLSCHIVKTDEDKRDFWTYIKGTPSVQFKLQTHLDDSSNFSCIYTVSQKMAHLETLCNFVKS